MANSLMTLRLDPNEATLEKVQLRFGLEATDLDPVFGVVLIDPKQRLYAIMISDDGAKRLAGCPGVHGPFANPGIKPGDKKPA